jgi:DNA-binding response OmpR family regulator
MLLRERARLSPGAIDPLEYSLMHEFTAAWNGHRAAIDPRRMVEDIQMRLSQLIGFLEDVAGQSEDPMSYVFGPNVLDRRRREVRRNGEHVHLSPRQYDLLLALAERQGAPVSRAELRRLVWNDAIPERSRAIDQAILELRQKLEDTPADPQFIRISSKFGYRLEGSWTPK